MAGFVLIHGAFHGGWCFDPVADMLRAKGHEVVTPDLPGMGGDEKALRAATLAGWAEFTLDHCRAMRAQLGSQPIILAGHSRGGTVISAAAEADPEAMDALVYICAVMVPAGSTDQALDVSSVSEPELMTHVSSTANGAGLEVDFRQAGRFFAQNSPSELSEGAASRLVTEPAGPNAAPPEVTLSRWGRVPRTYIECLEDRTIPIAGQRKMVELSPGTRTAMLDADHSPFYSAPEALTEALIAAAESYGPGN